MLDLFDALYAAAQLSRIPLSFLRYLFPVPISTAAKLLNIGLSRERQAEFALVLPSGDQFRTLQMRAHKPMGF